MEKITCSPLPNRVAVAPKGHCSALRQHNLAVATISEAQRKLRKRIRFLLPTPIALFMAFGLAFIANDSLAVKAYSAMIWIGIYETALILNIFARRRLARKLDRLLAGQCIDCGYDRRATPGRCPECGTIPPKQGIN
jgi:hypothetical protein